MSNYLRGTPSQIYQKRVAILMIAYLLILPGIGYFFNQYHPTGAKALLLSVLPALPVIGVFVAVGKYLATEQDEYLRMLMVRQALIATGFALSIATAWGFAESFDVAPHMDAYWVAILWFGGLGLGGCWNKVAGA